MSAIRVEINEAAPARFEVLVERPSGGRYVLDSGSVYAELVADEAYGTALADEVRPLPAGLIRAVVVEDGLSGLPDSSEVASAVAREILAS